MIYIVNGFPGSGKTTFEERACTIVGKDLYGYQISTIDFVKQLAKQCGWNGEKTPKNRKFLSDLKQLLIEWDDIPFKKIKEKIRQIKNSEIFDDGTFNTKSLIFIDCREPKEINKLCKEFNAKTILIQRKNLEYLSNTSDGNIMNFNYDIVIDNNGTLMQLTEKIFNFLKAEGYKPFRNFQIDIEGNLI